VESPRKKVVASAVPDAKRAGEKMPAVVCVALMPLRVTFGVVVGVPVMTTGAVAVTLVTVPVPPPLLVLTLLSMVIVMPRPLVRVMGGLDEASETVVIRGSNPAQQSCQRTKAHHQCHRSTALTTSKSQQKVWSRFH
jgi:hypothetical protein